jgi:DNA-binding NtrC family response regulator
MNAVLQIHTHAPPPLALLDAPVAQIPSEILDGMVGNTKVMWRMARLVRRSAVLDVSVLVRGESGTGKELVARALHRLGRRRDGPFVAINGATLCETLGPSALFGHVRGAFTGASETRQGAFRRADGGTLFIDEVAALSPRLQAALLRVVEEGAVIAVGSDQLTNVNVRLVTATCEPLEQLVAQGVFRSDLYQRLSTCVVTVPPLRDRLADLELLVAHFVNAAPLSGCRVSDAAIALLSNHDFPGNVRELRNVLTQASLMADGPLIDLTEIEMVLQARVVPTALAAAPLAVRQGTGPRRLNRPDPARAVALLEEAGGNISMAARIARMPRSSFRDLVRRAPAPKAGR